jgi:muramoyltetrapeptide carboxypeptidase
MHFRRAERMTLIKPNALQHGDTISVVAPAGPVDRQRIDRALARLEQRGFRYKTYGDLYRSQGYLAGDDATRAQELMAAFADPQTTAVWCARGGYGVVRLLERIDFDVVRLNPKVFIGFSDITALHVAFQQRCGLFTFHGPNLQDGFGKADDMPAANEAALWRAVLDAEQSNDRSGYAFDFPGTEQTELRAIATGAAAGPLTGGNLAVLCGLMGTPFEIQTAGRILFIEDVSERLYRIDRYLAQLRLAGKLQAAAGVLVGSFSYEDGEHAESQDDVNRLLEEYLAGLPIPVLAGFPAGHAPGNLTLPIGATFQLDADSGRVILLENAVST